MSLRLLGLLAVVLGLAAAEEQGTGPVLVLEPPPSTYITSSKGVTLRCAALGTPTPTITWVGASGEPVQSKPGQREVLPNGSLWLTPDSTVGTHTTFRCKATNPSGTVLSRATTLTTVLMSEVSVRAEGSRVGVGGVGVIRCHVGGSAAGGWAVAAWLAQDTPTAAPAPIPDAGRYVYGSGRTLYVQEVRQEDAHASFTCRVRHRASSTPITSTPTTLTVLAEPSAEASPRMDPELTRMMEVVEGRPFTIPCLAHSHPPPHYSWSREGVGGELGSVGVGGGRLWARGAVMGGLRAGPEDAGGYTCVAANGAGTDTAHFTLSVIQELHVTAHPPIQVVSAGSRVTISCRVQGTPVSEVRWYRDGAPLHAHRARHAHVVLQGRDALSIAGVGGRDAGMYQCVAANGLGEAQATTQLVIRDSPPVLRETFIEQTMQPGPSASLKCTAVGHPPPVLTWTLDGRPLAPARYGARRRVGVGSWAGVGGEVVSQVNVSSVDPLHGGMYECTAANAAGRVRHAARLNVYGPPTTRPPANVSVVDGSRTSLSCPVAGYPLSAVSWSLHGRPLTPTARRAPTAGGGGALLSIRRVELEYDVGQYSCVASDAKGRSASATFFLSVVRPPVLAELKFPSGLLEGMRLSVACSLLSGDLPITLRWTRDGKPLPRDPFLAETHSQFFSNLVFDDIRGRHAGRYACTASNSAASSTVSASMHVRVPPQWVVEPEDVAVVGGEEVALECHAQGTPTPTVTWKRNADGAGADESPAVVGDGWRVVTPRPGSLRIRDARAEDSGRYLCLAQNGVSPPIAKTVSLSVLEGARMEERVLNRSAAVGDGLSLRCSARGHLPLVFTWARDGVPIPASPSPGLQARLEEGGRTSVLAIASTGRLHAGVYTCQASNRYGADSMTFFLNVVERPDPPGHVHVREVTSRHVSLAWAPPFDGNSPLTHYLLQHWAAHDASATPTNTTLPRDLTHATLKGLSPGRVYHVQVRAVNARGSSPPSPTLSITTLQEPPTSPPTRLRAHARQQATITLTWQPPALHLSPGEVTGYQVGYQESDDNGEERWRSVRGTALTAEITGLRHYTAYQVTVRAVNEVGSGPSAQPVTVTTSQGVPSSPPENVKCDPLSSQALRVRWHPLPLNLSNGPVQGYKVFYKRTSNIEGSNAVEVKRTTNLETNLQGLGRYTNYSVRVLAFTAAGDGTVSNPVHCSTLQDVPGSPAGIRALPSGKDSITVSWLRPTHPNGILTHHTLYYRPLNAHQATRSMVISGESGALPWAEVSREVGGLDAHARYEFWVTASTRVGEGTASRVVSESPSNTVGARIRSFGQWVEVESGASLTLPCFVVGNPPPVVTWTHLGRDSIPNTQTLPDHSLHAPSVSPEAAGNYTCHAHNANGRDEAAWAVRVVRPPPPPTLRVQYATETSIHLSWDSAGDGGKPITGYVMRYRLGDDDDDVEEAWVEESVEPGEGSGSLHHLRCGSTYHVQVVAVNHVGRGPPSQTVNTRTRGSAPRQPRHQDLVSVNSSSVTLHLYTWPSGGCPISWFSVERRPRSSSSSSSVSSSRLAGDTDSVTLPDLAPLTWYQLRVTAHNAAGSAAATYDVATASLTGATLAPESVVEVVEAADPSGFLDPHVLAPVVSGVACTLALLLCVGLLLSRGRSRFAKGSGAGAAEPEGRGGSSLAELQNRRNDSQERLSPAARAKHDEAYAVEDSYEICPYATFSVPEGGEEMGGGDALDYTFQFQTFGHQECLEGQPQKPKKPSSFMGAKRREGVIGGAADIGPSSEIACISTQQTLPISSSVGGRGRVCRRRGAGEGDEGHASDSGQDTSGSPGATPGHGARDTYKVPVRLRRGPDFSLHPPDSSTESNDERSPLPPRRPPHQQQQKQPKQQPTNNNNNNNNPQQQQQLQQQQPPLKKDQHAPLPQHARRHHVFAQAHAHVLRSNTLDSVYSVEGAVGVPLRPPTSAVGVALRPPSGFSDSRELSEAECDRDPRETGLGGQKSRGQQPRRPFNPRTTNDYSIHV